MHYDSGYIEINAPDILFSFRRIPPATKFLAVGYVAITSALLFARVQEYSRLHDSDLKLEDIVSPIVQVIPNKVLKYPVSLVLSNFVDVNGWKVILNISNLLAGGSFIEQNWNNSRELLKYVLVLGSVTNLMVVFATTMLDLSTSHIRLDVPLDGNYTVLIGFPIVYKQLIPETTIFKLKNVGILSKDFRFKLLPIFTLSCLTAVDLFFGSLTQLLCIWFTFFVCWTYLRYYQALPTGAYSTVGDASDTFQLSYFFPGFIRPLLKPVFEGAYSLVCIRWGLIRPFQTDDIDKSNAIAQQRGAKKILESVEERRKQLALDVLQERLA